MSQNSKLGILVGGGPAPGINSVIGAATIRAELAGVPIVGIRDGFEHLMAGDTAQVLDLTAAGVSRIHSRGGSILGTSRANPKASRAWAWALATSRVSCSTDTMRNKA